MTNGNPFATLNGELPKAARQAVEAAQEAYTAGWAAYESHRAATARKRAFLADLRERIATAETSADLESRIASAEAITTERVDRGVLARLKSFLNPPLDVQAFRMVVDEAPQHLEKRDREEAALLERAKDLQARYRQVADEVLAGIISSKLVELATLLTRAGFPEPPDRFSERVGPTILPVIPGELHEIVRELGNAPMEFVRHPELEVRARERLAELGFDIGGA